MQFVVVLRYNIFPFLLRGLWIYLYYLISKCQQTTCQLVGMFFISVLNHYICFIALYFSSNLDSKIPKNSSSFCFCYCFWLVFITIFTLFYTLQVFHSRISEASLWSLSGSKSPKVSRTLLSILADLNNAVISMVLILPLISSSVSLFQALVDSP